MRFAILGPLQVVGAAGEIAINGRGRRIVLSVLLAQPNRAVSVDSLIDAVWADGPPRTAAKNIQVYVYQLRKALGEPGRIVSHPHGYRLVVHEGELDSAQFDALVGQARQAVEAGDIRSGRSALAQALDLRRGPAFADLAGVGALRESIARLDEARLQALEERIEADLALGAHRNVVTELSGLVNEYPLRERFLGHLMIALFRCGRQAEALVAYQKGYRLLRDELGVEPTPDLQRMQLDVLRGTDPGQTPQPALAQVPRIPAQLPARPRAFVGRDQEMLELDKLADAAAGVVTIVGMGGVGKTALAVDWSHRAAERFPDGRLYVDLCGHAAVEPIDPARALAFMLRALDVWALDIPPEIEAASALFRSTVAGKRLLVILDDAADPAQVRPLIPGAPGCLTIITSRNRLGGLVAREGASRIDLSVLTEDASQSVLAAIVGAERLAAEPEAAAQLVRQCGCLPLALRICAGQLADRPFLRIAQLVDEMTDLALDALRTHDDAESSITAVFHHSYRMLQPTERQLFCLMALAPSHDLTAQAAAALAASPQADARVALERLVSASVVDRAGLDRYKQHDLLREFAQVVSEIPEPQTEAALIRLAEWYLSTARAAAARVNPATAQVPLDHRLSDQAEPFTTWEGACGWLDAERANLVAVVAWAATHPRADLCWRLVDALRGYYNIRGFVDEYDWLSGLALRAAMETGDVSGIASSHLARANASGNMGDFDAMRRHALAAASAAATTDWLPGGAAAHAAAYHASFWLDRFGPALDHLEAAFGLVSTLGDESGLCNLHNEFTHLYVHMGRYAEAQHHYDLALALSTRLDVPVYQAHAWYNRGLLMRRLGRLEEAADLVSRARAVLRTTGLQFESACAGVIAEVYLDQGRLGEAELLLDVADEHVTHTYFRRVEHATVRRRARLLRLRGDTAAAEAALRGLLGEPRLSGLDRRLVMAELGELR